MLYYFIFLPLLALVIITFIYLWRALIRTRKELKEFTEAVESGDLTRKYPENKPDMKLVYESLNRISQSIHILNRRRESQQQYLKKIVELVDTGILAYQVDTFDVLLINEALSNMLNIPQIKNLTWLQNHDEELYNQLMEVPLGRKEIISLKRKSQSVRILTNTSLFETEGQTYKLIAFHNIKAAMEEVEANAWKGLLDVMTHEIMNSVTPVSSLADTLMYQLDQLKEDRRMENDPVLEDIESALEAIQRRSDGLLRFSEKYRSLSKKIIPEMKPVNLYQLVNSVKQLMEPLLKQKSIHLEIKSGDITVMANLDQALIDQTIINFITNATYALTNRPEPCITIYTGISQEGRPYITVADNGSGIPDEIQDKIFVPFFSTREKGSGIGLSLSREIIKLHQAELLLQTKEEEGSAFTILFTSVNP